MIALNVRSWRADSTCTRILLNYNFLFFLSIGHGRGVDLPVIVHVAGLGIARNNDPTALFSYDLSITDFNPKEGGFGGGKHTVKFLNFQIAERFAVINLKSNKEAKPEGILSKRGKYNSKQ